MTLTPRAAVALLVLALPVVLLGLPPGPGVGVTLLVLVVLVSLDLVYAGRVGAVHVTRGGARQVRRGEPATVALFVTNGGRRRVRGILRDSWVPSAGAVDETHRLDVAAGATRRLTTHLVPTRRGDRAATGVTVRSIGPLGLAAWQRTVPCPGTVRVVAPFVSRRHLPSMLARLNELDGRTSVRTRGEGTEFDALREYVDGDDARAIDWRATARRDEVVVRTWRPERDRALLVVIDTGRTAAARIIDEPRLDHLIEATLLLAAVAAAAGDRVDLVAYDRRVRAQVLGAPRGQVLARLVSATAALEADLVETDQVGMVSTVLHRAGRGALVVLLTGLDPTAVTESLVPALGPLVARHRVLLGAVADPGLAAMARRRGSAASVYEAAAAARTMTERARTVDLLTHRGVQVVDADPEALPARLVEAYLALKAAGRL
ncbi:MAG: DUF58 domain-containing protein [Actinomycetes bacterium]